VGEPFLHVRPERNFGPGEGDGAGSPVSILSFRNGAQGKAEIPSMPLRQLNEAREPRVDEASTKCDGPEGAETAIVTSGLWLLSSDPCSVAIRVATRAECRSLTDADQVERTLHLLGRNLPIGGFGRLGYEDVLCSNVDQNVVT
jgi:hypothetical protein